MALYGVKTMKPTPVLSFWEQLYEKAAAEHKTLYSFETLQEANRFMAKYNSCSLHIEDSGTYYTYYITVDSV